MTLYITNVSQDRIHNMHSYPCIYDSKPEDRRYLKVNARKDLLECYFRSNAFAYILYTMLGILVHDTRREYYRLLPFDVTFYFEEK